MVSLVCEYHMTDKYIDLRMIMQWDGIDPTNRIIILNCVYYILTVITLSSEERDRQAKIVTEQTEYFQLATASSSVFNGIRNVLIGGTFLCSGLISLPLQPRFTELSAWSVYFYYLACYTATCSVIVLIAPAIW